RVVAAKYTGLGKVVQSTFPPPEGSGVEAVPAPGTFALREPVALCALKPKKIDPAMTPSSTSLFIRHISSRSRRGLCLSASYARKLRALLWVQTKWRYIPAL